MLVIGNIETITEVEGPGKRCAIWFSGCSIRCKGCCNPHLFEKNSGKPYSVQQLINKIKSVHSKIEGISLLGGEPFEQNLDSLYELLSVIKSQTNLSVMIFTGYTCKELLKNTKIKMILGCCDLLVDGPFHQSLSVNNKRWIGSSNQTLHFLSDYYTKDDPRFTQPNEFVIKFNGKTISTHGFPHTRIVKKDKKS